jgi:DNA-binding SARP family transcriptional activator
MPPLQITLFGPVTVVHPLAPSPLKLSHSLQSFFAYLVLRKHLVAREVLMDVFWRDSTPERAHSSLTTVIWRLRQLLEPAHVQPGAYVITKKSGEVGFNWDSGHTLDTELFENQIYPILRRPLADLGPAEIQSLEAALTLYQGDLLEGLYEDWALRERERFRTLHLDCLMRLMHYHANHKNFEQSISYGQEILRCDPLREEIHRDLMRIYLASGQSSRAMQQYLRCAALLNQELGVPPLQETQLLYQQMIAHARPEPNVVLAPAQLPDLAQLIHELRLVKQSLDQTVTTLSHIYEAVYNYQNRA